MPALSLRGGVRGVLASLTSVAALHLAAPLAAQSDGLLRIPEATFAAVIDANCPARPATRLAYRAPAAHPDSIILHACARIALYRAKVPARPGPGMALGESWHTGALSFLRDVVRTDAFATSHPASWRRAGTLLGLLLLADNRAPGWSRERSVLLATAARSDSPPLLLRACADLALRAGAMDAAEQCARVGVRHAGDSVGAALRLSRVAAARDQQGAAAQWWETALVAATACDDWEEVTWHLGWMFTPEERTTWDTLPGVERAEFARAALVRRDIAEGEPAGHRWLTHLSRLAKADSAYRLVVGRYDLARFDRAASPESELVPELVARYWEPGVVAARPFREFRRTHPEYDDRAHILLRHGTPSQLIRWSQADTVSPNPREPRLRIRAVNTREAWKLDRPDGSLLVQFESERFDGSSEATRLVAGALGTYLCDVESRRCGLSMRSAAGAAPIAPEQLERLVREDRQLVATATQTDFAGAISPKPLRVVAAGWQLWDPDTERPLLVVAYGVHLKEMERAPIGDQPGVQFAAVFDAWDADIRTIRRDSVHRVLRLPDTIARDAILTGHIVREAARDGRMPWGVTIRQGDSFARASGEAGQRPGAAVRLSDLVLGSTRQQEAVTLGRERVRVGPLGAFPRTEPLDLYWQVKSATPQDSVMVRVEILRSGRTTPELAVSARQSFPRGVAAATRQLDLTRLEPGSYRLRVTLRNARGEELATSATALRVY